MSITTGPGFNRIWGMLIGFFGLFLAIYGLLNEIVLLYISLIPLIIGISLVVWDYIRVSEAQVDINLGTEHTPIFGNKYVSQGIKAQVIGGPAAIGIGIERKAEDKTVSPKFDQFGYLIPGTGKGVPQILHGRQWETVSIFKLDKWESTKISIGAQFLIGFEIEIDFRDEILFWFNFFSRFFKDDCE